MTDKELDSILARVEASRDGPWTSYIEGRDHTSGCSFIQVGEGKRRQEDIELSGATEADQDFIAAAKQDIPALIREVRRLRALLNNCG